MNAVRFLKDFCYHHLLKSVRTVRTSLFWKAALPSRELLSCSLIFIIWQFLERFTTKRHLKIVLCLEVNILYVCDVEVLGRLSECHSGNEDASRVSTIYYREVRENFVCNHLVEASVGLPSGQALFNNSPKQIWRKILKCGYQRS